MATNLYGLLVISAMIGAPALAADPAAIGEGQPFASVAPVAGGDLAAITGRADTAMEVRANNTSAVSHNAVIGQSETGTISFDAASFQNMTGLSVLSANTGNNVSINASLNVNVAIHP